MPTEIIYNVADADPWSAGENLQVGDRRVTAASQFIEVTVAGTTGGAAPNFTGQEQAILVDGTVSWRFLCERDYGSLSGFLADIGVGLNGNIVTNDETWKVHIWRKPGGYIYTGGSTSLSMPESCTATNKVIIEPAPGESIWEGINRGVDPVRYNPDYGVAIDVNNIGYAFKFGSGSGHCIFRNIQFRQSNYNAYGIDNQVSNAIAEGCLGETATNISSSRTTYRLQRGIVRNCIAIIRATGAHTAYLCTWASTLANCLTVFAGTTPHVDQVGFGLYHSGLTCVNCVSVNCGRDFSGNTPSGDKFGNISSDERAGEKFAGAADTISNAVNLVTDYSSAGVDCQPPDGSPVFTDSTAESVSDTYRTVADVFGQVRGLDDGTAYRGPICSLAAVPDYSLVVNNVAFASVVEAVNLAKSAPIDPDDAILGMVLEDVVTYAEASADVDDLAFASMVEAVEMSASRPVVVGDTTLGITVEGVTISASSALSVSDVLAQMTAEHVQMSGLMSVQVMDARLGMVTDSVNLQAETGVNVDDVTLQMKTESCTIQGEISLLVSDATLGSRLEHVGIIGEGGVLPSDVSLHMRADPVQLSMTSALSVDDVSLNMAIEEAGLSVDGQITIHNARLGAVIEEIGLTGARAVQIDSLTLRPMVGSVMMVSGFLDLPSRPGVSFLIDTRSISIVEDTRKVSIGG